MYANEETIQAIIDETLLRIPDKDEHKQFWQNTCIDITNFENKSIENLEPGAYIHYGALDSVYDLFPTNSFSAKRNPETVAILTSCEMFVLEIDRRYKQLEYQISADTYITFTDFAGEIYVYNATDIDGDTGNFSRQFDYLWRSSRRDSEGASGAKNTIPWYNQSETFRKYVDNEYVSTTFGYDSIVHKKGSAEYVYSFPEETGTIALSENIPTKLSELTNDSGYITINSIGNGTLTITQNGTNKGIFSANQSSNSTIDITVPTKLSDLTNDSGYITIGSVGNGTLTITQNGTSKGIFSANQSGNASINLTDTTYESKSAASGGTAVSLVTTGEKYAWNAKSNFSGAYADLTGLPTLGTAAAKDIPASGNASTTQVVLGNDTRLTNSRPASDVYAWAKASTKPSYTASEVGALPLSGGTMTGTINTLINAVAINFRAGTQYPTTVSHQTSGDEALVFASKYAPTSFIFVNDEDSITNHASDRWKALTPGLQIKNNKVAIGKLIANGVTPTYALDVNGTVNATSFEGSGANLTGVVHTETDPTVPSWAKASTKPSYYYKELLGEDTRNANSTPSAYQTKSGGTEFIEFKYRTIIGAPGSSTFGVLKTINPWWDSSGGLPVQFYTDNTGVFAFRCATSTSDWGEWQSIARTSEIPTKLSQLTNDSGYITSSGSCANANALQNSSPDEGTGARTIVKRTSLGQVKAVFYNMSGEENDINSFTSHVAFVSSDGWIRKTSKANFSTWLLTWTKLGSTTGNTQLSYTGTYAEFFVILDLGFYAETFYFVAPALGGNRYFFGGTTNTSDGSSWVLRASRSNSTYSFKADRVHQDGTDYTSQVNVSVYAR